jgi:hypothetical protein
VADAPSDSTAAEPEPQPRDHYTRVVASPAQGGSRWYRHTWDLAAARAGLLDAFLAADQGDKSGWTGQDMRVQDADGATVAVMVDPARLDRLEAAAAELADREESPPDGGYHPAVHGPCSGGDGMLIDTDPIRRGLAWMLARYDLRGDDPDREKIRARAAELDKHEGDWLLSAAVTTALSVMLMADHDGVVPIRAWSAPSEGAAVHEARWVLAWTTPARGLYVRGGSPQLWGEDYAVVTGAGWKLRGGFLSREIATEYAVAIATAAPQVDWRTWDTPITDAPPDIRDPLAAENRRWTVMGLRDQPAAEADTAPPTADPPESAAGDA